MSGTTSGVEFTAQGDGTHLKIFQGKTINFEIIWGGSTPIDVTGFTALFQARDKAGALMLEISTTNGGAVVGGADGKITFTANAAASRAVKQVGLWELEINNPAGDVYRVAAGTVTPVMEIAQ